MGRFAHNSAIVALCMFATGANVLEGSNLPAVYEANNLTLEKRGEYRYVYRMFFNLYDAGLFTEKETTAKQILNADAAVHLSFRYLRTIEKSIILKSAARMLEKNLSVQELEQISERVDTINAAYTTVEKGDRSSLTYIPGVGTTLKINNEPIATIEGKDFAQLYFQIWLGEQPVSKAMKEALLGI
ncbi:MAG: chalcone isomerase family protein [Lentimonas sp.]